jgi:hypothetical protein
MEGPFQINLISVPRPVKIVVAIFLASCLGFDFYISIIGVLNNKPDWVSATPYLFGPLLPIIMIVTGLYFAESGVKAMQTKTSYILTTLIPQTLSTIPDEELEFFSPHRRKKISNQSTHAEILIAMNEGCSCDCKILLPKDIQSSNQGKNCILIRLELNVKKITVNYFLNPRLVAKIAKADLKHHYNKEEFHSIIEVADKNFEHYFEHTLAGSLNEGYKHNKELFIRTVENTFYACIILTKTLPDNFLWKPSEQLYFAQDLVFLIRSLIIETSKINEIASSQSIEHQLS